MIPKQLTNAQLERVYDVIAEAVDSVPAETPWTAGAECDIHQGTHECEMTFPVVPAGKRLVVESLTSMAEGPEGGGGMNVAILDGNNMIYDYPLEHVYDFNTRTRAVGAHPVTLFASAGERLTGVCARAVRRQHLLPDLARRSPGRPVGRPKRATPRGVDRGAPSSENRTFAQFFLPTSSKFEVAA